MSSLKVPRFFEWARAAARAYLKSGSDSAKASPSAGRNPLKWFFAYKAGSNPDYEKLIKVAVVSAQTYTSLDPYALYDGEPSALTDWLEEHGVKIIHHRSQFYDDIITKFGKKDMLWALGGTGAFLRVDIPRLLRERGLDDEYVLYTDCDVMFVADVGELSMMRPQYLACAPEFDRDNWDYINTGVMLMNVKGLLETYDAFIRFVAEDMERAPSDHWAWDQSAYNGFYKGNIAKLAIEYNWKPYWGDSPNKKIVHFHGLKPMWLGAVEGMKGTEAENLFDLYNRDRDAYRKLCGTWEGFLSRAGKPVSA